MQIMPSPNFRLRLTGAFGAGLLLASTSALAQEPDTDPSFGEWGIDLSAMDTDVDPGDDFYRYVSGEWLERESIPAGYPNWNAFTILGRKTDKQVDATLTDLMAQDLKTGTTEQQIADFYRSYMDVDQRNRLGIEPLRDLIDGYMTIASHDDVYRMMALPESSSPISFGVLADPGTPERQLMHVAQGGLTMPDPVYYTGEGEQFDAVRAEFLDYAETVFEKAGFTDATWRSYLVFHVLDDYAELLTDDLNDANFRFHATALAGVETQRPLNERAITMTGALMGEPIGKLYAERYFPADYRETVNTMIGYILAEYRDRFKTNEWMDDQTRAEALAKLDQVVSHIGYSDRYHDMSSLRIAPTDLVGNVRWRTEWAQDDALAKLKEPTRKWEWPFDVQEINAGYVASLNSITFPGGILQPPFFHPGDDEAVNFGSIGVVIGHELGHAFDDQGKTYDGTGKIRNWWTDQSEKRFRERTAKLVEQFNSYSPIEGENVNGALTLGENIGDLGGLAVGYAAYRRYVRDQQGGEAPVIDGFTGDQRFFLSWGQLWRNLTTDAETRRRLVADVHSPGEFRANGAVRNVDGWYEAFDVGPDGELYLPPEQRVHIW